MIPLTDRQRELRAMGRTMSLDDVRRVLAALEDGTRRLVPERREVTFLPCHACGAPGVRNLRRDGYCSTHLAALYRTFDPIVFADGGVGLPDGQLRPEYGPAIEDLRCCRCEATWCGVAGDACEWCQRSLQRQREHQAELVVQPPDVDPDDITLEARYEGWRKRLAVAVEAELISATKAENAWRRAIDRLADHAAA